MSIFTLLKKKTGPGHKPRVFNSKATTTPGHAMGVFLSLHTPSITFPALCAQRGKRCHSVPKSSEGCPGSKVLLWFLALPCHCLYSGLPSLFSLCSALTSLCKPNHCSLGPRDMLPPPAGLHCSLSAVSFSPPACAQLPQVSPWNKLGPSAELSLCSPGEHRKRSWAWVTKAWSRPGPPVQSC